ncbi:MAG TPA: ABC transporter ATP-binding protein [Acidimicrobiales bacterium]
MPTAAVAAVAEGALELRDVSKSYGHGPAAVRALDGVDLRVTPGELVCIVGASGCGKSTLLNLIARLDSPSAGELTSCGRVALMFQEAALFPWLTIGDNVGLALKLAGAPRSERKARADELLDLVHLHGLGARRPHELSGGMRQRVALARALAQGADILLMDEPFGALDAMTRDLLHDELERIWQQTNITIVFVTHNVREAVRLADRVVLLSSRPGRVARTFDIDLPRPRRIDGADESAFAAHITDQLRAEVARHGRR